MEILATKLLRAPELIEVSFKLFGKAWKKLLGIYLLQIAATLGIVVLGVIVAVILMGGSAALAGVQNIADLGSGAAMASISALIIGSLVFAVAFFWIIFAFYGAGLAYCKSVCEGQEITVMNAVAMGMRKGWSMTWTCFLFMLLAGIAAVAIFLVFIGPAFIPSFPGIAKGLLAFLGFIAFIVFYFYLVSYMLIIFPVMFENKSGLGAITAGKQLVTGRYWSTLGYLMLVFLIMMAISVALYIVMIIFVFAVSMLLPQESVAMMAVMVLLHIVSFAVNVMVSIYMYPALTALYVNRKIFFNRYGRTLSVEEGEKEAFAAQNPQPGNPLPTSNP